MNIHKLVKQYRLKPQVETAKGRKFVQRFIGSIVRIPNAEGQVARWHNIAQGSIDDKVFTNDMLTLIVEHEKFKMAALEQRKINGNIEKKKEFKLQNKYEQKYESKFDKKNEFKNEVQNDIKSKYEPKYESKIQKFTKSGKKFSCFKCQGNHYQVDCPQATNI